MCEMNEMIDKNIGCDHIFKYVCYIIKDCYLSLKVNNINKSELDYLIRVLSQNNTSKKILLYYVFLK